LAVRWGGSGADTLLGNLGNDTLIGGVCDTLDGGDDTNIAGFSNSGAGVTIDLSSVDGHATGSGVNADGTRLRNIEHPIGSDHNDVLGGDSAGNSLSGGLGDVVYRFVVGAIGQDAVLDAAGAEDQISNRKILQDRHAARFVTGPRLILPPATECGCALDSVRDHTGRPIRWFKTVQHRPACLEFDL